MVLGTVGHLTSEEMLRAFDSNVTISLVNINCGSEALSDFLGEANLLLWDQLVGKALGLGTLSSVLGHRSDDLLGGDSSLSRGHVALA